MSSPDQLGARKLNIAVLSSPVITAPTTTESVPPGWSGAPENVMYDIAVGMARRGHNVTFFATGDTKVPWYFQLPKSVPFLGRIEVVSVGQHSSYEDSDIGIERHKEHERTLIEKCYALAAQGKFDIIHSRFVTEAAEYVRREQNTPTVVTMHSVLKPENDAQLRDIADIQDYVFISRDQRRGHEFLRTPPDVPVVYNGVDLKKFSFDPQGGEGLVSVARLHREKNPDIAIQSVQQLGKPLVLVGSTQGDVDEYWRTQLSPLIQDAQKDLISQTGYVDHDNIPPYFQHAKASLHSTLNREPFGLSVAESMACGTPVIAFSVGSMPELVEDGATGFLVDPSKGIEGFKAAIERLYNLSSAEYANMRRACRERVERLFGNNQMIEGYERAYQSILRRERVNKD